MISRYLLLFCAFDSLTSVLWRAEFLKILIKSDLSIFSFVNHASGSISKNSLPKPKVTKLSSGCYFKNIPIVCFTLRSIIYFRLIFESYGNLSQIAKTTLKEKHKVRVLPDAEVIIQLQQSKQCGTDLNTTMRQQNKSTDFQQRCIYNSVKRGDLYNKSWWNT